MSSCLGPIGLLLQSHVLTELARLVFSDPSIELVQPSNTLFDEQHRVVAKIEVLPVEGTFGYDATLYIADPRHLKAAEEAFAAGKEKTISFSSRDGNQPVSISSARIEMLPSEAATAA